jgi:transcriptional regulator with XRE-family HTH domain
MYFTNIDRPMEEKVKIEKIMEDLNMNSAQFAAEIGIQGSTLSHILNGRNKPSLDVLKKILNRFRNINSEWLILGIGSIYHQEKHSHAPTLFDSIDESDSKSDTSAINLVDKNSIDNSLNQKEKVNNTSAHKTETVEMQNTASNIQVPNSKLVKSIIVYYDDNTFQEFESKS